MKKFVYQESNETSGEDKKPEKPVYKALGDGEGERPKNICMLITDEHLKEAKYPARSLNRKPKYKPRPYGGFVGNVSDIIKR